MANKTDTRLRSWGWLIVMLLTPQCVLGALNVVNLPMSIALRHTVVATLLLMAAVTLLRKLTHQPLRPPS